MYHYHEINENLIVIVKVVYNFIFAIHQETYRLSISWDPLRPVYSQYPLRPIYSWYLLPIYSWYSWRPIWIFLVFIETCNYITYLLSRSDYKWIMLFTCNYIVKVCSHLRCTQKYDVMTTYDYIYLIYIYYSNVIRFTW